MRKLLTFFSLILLFLSFAPKQLNAQVITGIGNFEMCYGMPVAMPVLIQNMSAVDTFRLVLQYDETVIEFVEHFAVNGALLGGTFSIDQEEDALVLNWARSSSASIATDTLVWLRFKGLVGSTTLQWNEQESFYHTTGGNAFVIYQNGNATVSPKINVLLTEINATCLDLCEANYQADVTGGVEPYNYLWNGVPGRFDNVQTNLCPGKNVLSVTDAKGCRIDSIFTIEGLPGADVNIIIEGNEDTTIYLENPVLTFRFEENFPTHVVEPPLWEFGDGDTAVSFNPTHVYSRANTNTDGFYLVKLHINNENGCGSVLEIQIPIKDAKLKIPGVITPNGDSYNESFMILNENKTGSGEDIKITTEFQRMEVLIFDRWGRKIYDDSNYQSDWRAQGVPDGAYYYKLKTVGFYNTETYKGSITILGSGVTD
jgi:hypothetical protein